MSSPDINEIREELKEVVKTAQATQITLTEILTELRVVKPRVEKLESDIEALKEAHWKTKGLLALVTFLGAPAVAGIVLLLAKTA